jgi:hypothetical protein
MKRSLTIAVVIISAALSLAVAVTTAHGSTVSRANAVREAKDYLDSQAFSYKSLVDQLKFEGFSTADANYGVSHSGANWMKQAVAEAKDYLRSQAFSRSGLIDQLEFEGFTPAQALHGVRATGL